MDDAIVIGGGVAGLSAATWLGRYRRRVLLVDGDEPRNRWVEHAHGYLGFDPVDPTTLLQRARDDLANYPTVRRRQGRATSAEADEAGGFVVHVDGQVCRARRLVVATGVVDTFPEVEGFFSHYGADVFHCPTCDGYQAENRAVVAFGWSAEVAGFALDLLDWAASVTVVTDGQRFEGDDAERAAMARHGVDLVEDEAVELLGDRGDLRGVRLRSGDRLDCRVAFFSIDHEPVTWPAEQLGCKLDADGYVAVDHCARTSVPGVYAAGDLTPGIQLLQVGAAKGCVAGTHCALSLRGERAAPETPPPGPDTEQELRIGN